MVWPGPWLSPIYIWTGKKHNLTGWIKNSSDGVIIEIQEQKAFSTQTAITSTTNSLAVATVVHASA